MDFLIKPLPVKSGQGELSKRTYQKVKGKRFTWYIPIQDNPADNIYIITSDQEGFGGAEMKFPFPDGSYDLVKGPWHSNSAALLSDTGIDLSDKCLTFGVLSKGVGRASNSYDGVMTDVVYKDEDWVIGPFDRITKMAKEFANRMGIRIYYYSQSSGGSMRHFFDPEEKKEE